MRVHGADAEGGGKDHRNEISQMAGVEDGGAPGLLIRFWAA